MCKDLLKVTRTKPQVALFLIKPYRPIYLYQCSPSGKMRKIRKIFTSGEVAGSKRTCKYAASVSRSMLRAHAKSHQDPSSASYPAGWGNTRVKLMHPLVSSSLSQGQFPFLTWRSLAATVRAARALSGAQTQAVANSSYK